MKHADPNVMTLSNQSQTSINDDVLHIPSTSKPTPEEISKAIAHHNKHHPKDKPLQSAQSQRAAAPASKKNK
jgi:hypothetical protein